MKKKIFTILGDYYHDHDLILKALNEAIKPFEDQIDMRDIKTTELTDVLNEKPDLVIIDKENRLNPTDELVNCWMTPEIESNISNFVSKGGSWLAWHSGLASYPEEGQYSSMVKGTFKFHPHVNKTVKYILKEDNFIKVKDLSFEVIDEHYFVECDQPNTNVFLLSKSLDGDSIAGWAHYFGDGRVCCVAPTHRSEGLSNHVMIKLIGESIKWCLEI